MNITTDNYEAYLIDYLDGNLNADETEQLKQFVAAQGLDWAELTEGLPLLEAPQIVYQNKSELRSLSLSKGRHKNAIIPLYVKIASAAAAAGLLLTIGLWPEKSLPKVEPIAELQAIQPHLTVTEDPLRIVPKRAISFTESQGCRKETKKQPTRMKEDAIAALSPMKAQEVAAFETSDFALASDIELLRYRLGSESTMARLAFESAFEEEMPTSFIGRGIYRMTEGRHASIGDLINAGLHFAKKGIKKASADAALATYYRAEEQFEEAKEYWQEKRGE